MRIPLYHVHNRGNGLDEDVALIYSAGSAPNIGNLQSISNGYLSTNWQLSVAKGYGGVVTATEGQSSCGTTTGIQDLDFYVYTFVDDRGVTHNFPGSSTTNCSTFVFTQLNNVAAEDGSGIVLLVGNGPSAIVEDASGNRYSNEGSGSVTDTNGNVASSPRVFLEGSLNFCGEAGQSSTITQATPGNTPVVNHGCYTFTTGATSNTVTGRTPDVVSYIDSNGKVQDITTAYKQYPVTDVFNNESSCPASGSTDGIPCSSPNYLLSSITFPDGTSYSFAYESDSSGNYSGRISNVTLPGGGTIAYTYSGGYNNTGAFLAGDAAAEIAANTHITLARITQDGTTTYNNVLTSADPRSNALTSQTTIAYPDGHSEVASFVHDSTFCASCANGGSPFGPETLATPNGTFYETARTIYTGAVGTTVLQSESRCYNGATSNCTTQNITLPFSEIASTITSASGLTSQNIQHYNAAGFLVENDEYGFGASTLTRKMLTTYASLGNNIQNRPSSVTIYNGSGTIFSQTNYSYDEFTLASSVATGLAAVSGSRGNQTSAQALISGNVFSTSHMHYDAAGQPVSTTDGNGNVTSYGYDSTDTYLADKAYPSVAGGTFSESYSYDGNTGLLTQTKDVNGNATAYTYDSMMRNTGVCFPGGGYTLTGYPSSTTQTVGVLAGSGPGCTPGAGVPGGSWMTTTIQFDGYGRPLHEINPSGATIDISYDSMGRKSSQSNPHLSTGASTDGTAFYLYDPLGRPTKQTNQDGSFEYSCYEDVATAGQPNCKSHIGSQTGIWVDYQDENGNQWQRTSDALGRLVEVVEPNGTSVAASMETDYTYDVLNNLLSVNQKGISGETARNRSFTYDSLSRLLTSTNPETGAISYGYDANSNMTSKTDARGIKTSYTYDTLNRLTQKTYNDGVTNTSLYGYDSSSINFVPVPQNGRGNVSVSLANTIGRLTFASSTTSGSLDAFSYDSMGRLVNQWSSAPSFNIDNGTIAAISAGYDLAGNMTSLTYPDGRTVSQQWDGGGHLTQVSDVSGQYQYLTPSTTYWPNGTPSAVFYGNGVGNGTFLNNRLQADEIGIVRVGSAAPGSYPGNNNLAVKEYCYGPATSAISAELPGCPSRGSANNGNIWQVMDVLHSGYTENLSYDSLNRLGSFSRVDGSLSQTYAYDSFGNLNQTSPGTLQNAVSYGANNRINSASYGYDNAGNLTASFNGISTAYSYDAENRLTGVNNGAATYTYDGSGDRVRKDNGSTWTEYVRFGGQVVAEKTSDGFWSDYIYANGKRIAKVDNNDIRIHMSGTNCSGCGIINTFAGTSSLAAFVNGTVIQNGDLLTWRQFQDGVAAGGISVAFNNDTVGTSGVLHAADGQLADADTRTGTGLWYQRVANLSGYAGDTVSALTLYNYQGGAAGNWDIYLADISLVHPDGTSVPIYYRSLESLPQFTPGGAESNVTVVTEKVAVTPNPYDVTYYSTNQIGSSILLTDSAGWPVSSDTYYPFGQEPTTSADGNHYKFTGKERDTESGLDYFGARYYGSNIGRFMSPDPSGLAYADPSNPQSFNLYSYVRNNPLSFVDPSGLTCQKGLVDNGDGTFNPVYSDDGDGKGCPAAGIRPDGSESDTAIYQFNYSDSTGAFQSSSVLNLQLPYGGGVSGSSLGSAPSKPCSASGPSKIISASATTNGPTIVAGTAIGGAIGGEPGAFVGGIIGSMFGVGGNVSYVPSTHSLYAGPTAVFAPGLGGGNGISANYVNVPSTQNANSIANGPSFSITFQPNPFFGSVVTKSPGSGPPVVGPSVGTRVPVSFGAGYNICLHNCGC
ncbi:RHS repeat-associated core domain-containing protein [Granulicella mallensis]|nr:RHS repeat-associated core domain-containing protein [Granulicella mallensis]